MPQVMLENQANVYTSSDHIIQMGDHACSLETRGISLVHSVQMSDLS